MRFSRWIAKRRWGLIVGLCATILGCVLWQRGLLRRIDNLGLDLHFRKFGTIQADPRIVLIDIDDTALETVPYSWPWPRRVYADLLRLLNELGAQSILLDIVFDTPDEPRPISASLGRDYDIDEEIIEEEDGSSGPVRHIFDDDEFVAAMKAGGNIYIPMFSAASPLFETASLYFDQEVMFATLDSFKIPFDKTEALAKATQQSQFKELYYPHLLFELLHENYDRSDGELAEQVPQETLVRWLPEAKRIAAQVIAAMYLNAHPNASFREFFEAVSSRPLDTITADREELKRAFRQYHAIKASFAHTLPARLAVESAHFSHVYEPTLPLAKFAQATKRVGFVGWNRESSGPIVRELPLFCTWHGHLLPQLGFWVAWDALSVDRITIELRSGVLSFGTGSQGRRLPVNRYGESLLNWHAPPSGQWQDSFTHVPISRLIEVILNREAIRENNERVRIKRGKLVELRHANTPAEFAEYARMIHRFQQLIDQRRLADSASEGPEAGDELEVIEKSIRRIEEESLDWLRWIGGEWEKAIPQAEEERREKETIQSLYKQLVDGELEQRMASINEGIEMRIKPILAELRSLINARFCFVGYTASAQADLVATPVHPAMPGVMVHANIVNTLLQNQPAWRASPSTNLFFIVIVGLVVTWMSCGRSGAVNAGIVVVFLTAIWFACAWVFRAYTYHLPSLTTAVLGTGVWSAVTLSRQLTEERARRRFHAALAQYTAPAIAAQIADRASIADLAPRSATVSCFFADLEGFTSLSERLGPERTQRVLNPYLKAISQVLIDHGGMVNKFMGDGIFAFFNAPIWPCADHAVAACKSALAAVKALDLLNHDAIEKEAGAPLKMRIGLSTGEAFVGDYGSDTKLDYTCIGDTVNTANRLQTANKELGTTILVDEQTRRDANENFEFRSIGELRLAGKAAPTSAYELAIKSVTASQTIKV